MIPPYHWWRTVFFLIPAISLYTIVLGTLSIGSSLFEKRGYFAHWCARTWSRLILRTTGVHVDIDGLERLVPGRTYLFVANHQSIYDIPILFWSLPYQLRIIAKESLGRFPFLGWHLRRTGHMLVDRRRPDRAAIFLVGVSADIRRVIAHRVSRRHEESRWSSGAVQEGELLSGARGRHACGSAVGHRQPACDAERSAGHLSRTRPARRSRPDRHQRARRVLIRELLGNGSARSLRLTLILTWSPMTFTLAADLEAIVRPGVLWLGGCRCGRPGPAPR